MKTKTTINTSLCPRSIILESLLLNTCCLGPKTEKIGHIYFFMTFNKSFG